MVYGILGAGVFAQGDAGGGWGLGAGGHTQDGHENRQEEHEDG
jgi:hypothetical protein